MNFTKINYLIQELTKIAFIKKAKGKYIVFSDGGKKMGEYNSYNEAEKNLKRIHFENKTAETINLEDADSTTLSGIMRLLRKRCDEDQVILFLKEYHNQFLQCMKNKQDYMEEHVLEKTIKNLDTFFTDDILMLSRQNVDDDKASVVEGNYTTSLAPFLPSYRSYDDQTDGRNTSSKSEVMTGEITEQFPQNGQTEGADLIYGLGPTQMRDLNSV